MTNQEPQGEPLEATTPPATAGEWRWAAINPTGGAEISHYELRRPHESGHGYEVKETLNGWEMVTRLNNAASRLRIAEELLEEIAAGMKDGHVLYWEPAEDDYVTWRDRYDALKGASHE